ncbi:hypothetical protein [Burkholderia ambifaria]|uniref:hypothetical protein n=1 Tax=Burkholderia ambifaria TaxID=152480 RepID=UPI002FE2C9FC
MNMKNIEARKVMIRYVKAYLSLLAMILFFAVFSFVKGGGWKPLLIPAPLFVLIFAGITYKFIRELGAMNNKGGCPPSDNE